MVLCSAGWLALVLTNQAAESLKVSSSTNSTVFKDQKEKISYILGRNIGNNFKRQEIEVDMDVLRRGIKDGLDGANPAISDAESRDLMTSYQQEVRTKQTEKRKQLGEKNKTEGEAFLAKNKSRPGVKTTASGLQYEVINEGKGEKPKSNDVVTVNYKGTFVDGTEFDSSEKTGRPATFGVTGVIKGWTEALMMMSPGAKYKLYIPSNLAYGEPGRGAISPNATLIFEVELVSAQPPPPPIAPQSTQPGQPITSDIIKVPSAEEMKKGAKIEIIKPDQLEREKAKQSGKALQ